MTRISLFAIVITLAVAMPARADLISVTFQGNLTAVSPFLVTAAPELSEGDPFTATFTFRSGDDDISPVSFNIGPYATDGPPLCAQCVASLLDTLPAVSLFALPGAMVGPNGFIHQTLFTVILDQGWQSGTMSVFLENAFSVGGFVDGRITSSTVPEPAAWSVTLVGISLAGLLLTQRSRQAHRRGCA